MMAKRSIVSDEALVRGAQDIADDLQIGQPRRLKLAKIIDDHLDWFARAQARGLEWNDIIDLLFKSGVTRPDGRPLSRGHLSALVWRKQKAKKMTSNILMAQSGESGARPNKEPSQQTAPVVAMPAGEAKTIPRKPSGNTPPPGRVKKSLNNAGSEQGTQSENQKVLAYMRRAARARSGD